MVKQDPAELFAADYEILQEDRLPWDEILEVVAHERENEIKIVMHRASHMGTAESGRLYPYPAAVRFPSALGTDSLLFLAAAQRQAREEGYETLLINTDDRPLANLWDTSLAATDLSMESMLQAEILNLDYLRHQASIISRDKSHRSTNHIITYLLYKKIQAGAPNQAYLNAEINQPTDALEEWGGRGLSKFGDSNSKGLILFLNTRGIDDFGLLQDLSYILETFQSTGRFLMVEAFSGNQMPFGPRAFKTSQKLEQLKPYSPRGFERILELLTKRELPIPFKNLLYSITDGHLLTAVPFLSEPDFSEALKQVANIDLELALALSKLSSYHHEYLELENIATALQVNLSTAQDFIQILSDLRLIRGNDQGYMLDSSIMALLKHSTSFWNMREGIKEYY